MSDGMTEYSHAKREMCERIVALYKELDDAKAVVDRIKKEIDGVTPHVLQFMADMGIRFVPMQGGVRIHALRSLHPSRKVGIGADAAIEALRKEGLEWMVSETYSASSLRAYLTEREREIVAENDVPSDVSEILPDGLKPYFQIYEEHKLSVVKG